MAIAGILVLLGTGPAAAQPISITTFAGPAEVRGADDGIGDRARFNNPQGLAADKSGNVYVADTDNHAIRKITPAGLVTTLAGLAKIRGSIDGTRSAARFDRPRALATDAAGNVYVVETGKHTIRKISAAGVVTTLAGLAGNEGSVDGIGAAARFRDPVALAADDLGNVYVADTGNGTIRRISALGVVTTLAGLAGELRRHADGIGSAARFEGPGGLATDSNGNIYVADSRTIRKVTPDGAVTTLAGSVADSQSYADGTGSAARFSDAVALAADANANLYVAETYNGTIRKVTPGGVVTTLAGAAGELGSRDGTGRDAWFHWPRGVAADHAGNVFVVESDIVRRIAADGVVSTFAGPSLMSWDGTGSAARFSAPGGVAIDRSGIVYAADTTANTIRRITPAGRVTTFAGGGTHYRESNDGQGTAARFYEPQGLATDSSSNVYVADTGNCTIRKITPSGTVTTLAGSPDAVVLFGPCGGSADGKGKSARFRYPSALAVDSSGNIYVADTDNSTIRKVTPGGTVSTVAGIAGTRGTIDGTGPNALFSEPRGIAVDTSGNVYVSDVNTIRKISPGGVVTTLAGKAFTWGSADGSGSEARFSDLGGLSTDSDGNVYVADRGNDTIRKVTPSGTVTTIAGLAGNSASTDGVGAAARFYDPTAVAVGTSGTLYIADSTNGVIRKGSPALSDAATIDLPVGSVGLTRVLDTSSMSAASWEWSVIRQPAGSSAVLSSTLVRNPTFTPDVADLYQFRLIAGSEAGTSVTVVSFQAISLEPVSPLGPRRRGVRH